MAVCVCGVGGGVQVTSSKSFLLDEYVRTRSPSCSLEYLHSLQTSPLWLERSKIHIFPAPGDTHRDISGVLAPNLFNMIQVSNYSSSLLHNQLDIAG